MSEIEVPNINGYTLTHTDLKGARTVFRWRTSPQWPLPSHSWCRFPIRKRFREGLKAEGKQGSREWFQMACVFLHSSVRGCRAVSLAFSCWNGVQTEERVATREEGKWSIEVPPLISEKNSDLCGSISYSILARFASQVFMSKYEAKNKPLAPYCYYRSGLFRGCTQGLQRFQFL